MISGDSAPAGIFEGRQISDVRSPGMGWSGVFFPARFGASVHFMIVFAVKYKD